MYKLPSDIQDVHIYYIDEFDRIILVERFGQAKNIKNIDHYEYTLSGYSYIHISSGNILRNVGKVVLKGENVEKVYNFGGYGYGADTYIYSEDCLIAINMHNIGTFGIGKGKKSNTRYEIEYDCKGRMQFIYVVYLNEHKEQRYPSVEEDCCFEESNEESESSQEI